VRGFDELRELLLGKLPTRVERIEQGHRDPDALTQDVARVLPHAIGQRQQPDRELARALMPSVEDALTTSVKRNPKALIDAIFPIIGPAIRKAVAQAMGGLVEGINRTVEAAFTVRGIKWRIEAWRTGRSYGEVVLAHSLVFRVEHVYLIHSETGLLLHNIGPLSPVGEDPEVVSGMFTAIQDFVRDSFGGAGGGSLDQAQVGDLTLLGEYGPRALIAVVVRGKPPPALAVRMQETLEKIHADYVYELEHFTGDNAPFQATEPLLEDCLLVEEKPKRRRIAGPLVLSAAGVGLILLIVMAFMRARFRAERREEYLALLAREPGLVVVSAEEDGGVLRLHGLRDPAAVEPTGLREVAGLAPEDVDERWDTFYDGSPAFVVARARRALAAPSTVEMRLEGETLSAEGDAPRRWYAEARRRAPFLPGVTSFEARRDARAEAASSLVFFEPGGAVLSREEGARLDELVEVLHELDAAAAAGGRRVQVVVVGRASDAAQAAAAGDLARERARAVMERLGAEQWAATAVSAERIEGRVAAWIVEAERRSGRAVGVWFVVREES